MTRAQLVAALWGSLQRQFTEVGIENSDDTGNLKEPVDSTLLALEVEWEDLPDATLNNADVPKALMVARYYGLAAVLDAALNRVDITLDAPNTSVRDSQFVANVERALARAKADAEPFIDTGASSWAVGSFSLGYTEPIPTEY